MSEEKKTDLSDFTLANVSQERLNAAIFRALKEIQNDTGIIRKALYGDKETDASGVFSRIHDLETHKNVVTKAVIYVSGGLAVVMGMLGLCWDIVRDAIKHKFLGL